MDVDALASNPYADHSGALFLGICFPWGFFGVLSMQVYMYFQAFPKDTRVIKALVYGIYMLQFSQIIMFTHASFNIFGPGFGDWPGIDRAQSDWFSVCMVDGIVSMLVQSFYAWRIYIISRQYTPTILIMTTSILSLATSITVGVYIKQDGHLSKIFEPTVLILTQIWVSSAAACDILIAVCMTYYLKRHSPSGHQFQNTANLVNRIIRVTIETGSLTAGFAIATLIVMCLPKPPAYFTTLLAILSGLYSTTLMTVLNSRIKYGSATSFKDGHSEVEISMNMMNVSASRGGLTSSGSDHPRILVSVKKEEPSVHRDPNYDY